MVAANHRSRCFRGSSPLNINRTGCIQELRRRVGSHPDPLVIVPLSRLHNIYFKDGGPALANQVLGPVGAGSHFAPLRQVDF